MSKKTNDNTENLVLGAGALAALGSYAFFRKMPNNPSELQKAIKDDGLLVGLGWAAKKSKKAIGKLIYDKDLKFIKVKKEDNIVLTNKPIYFKNIDNFTYRNPNHKLEINNPEVEKKLFTKIRTKDSLANIDSLKEYTIKTKPLKDALNEVGVSTLDLKHTSDNTLQDAFKKIEHKYGPQFLKPKEGERLGKGTNQIYGDLISIKDKIKVKPNFIQKLRGITNTTKPNKRGLAEIKTKLDNYIISPKIDVKAEHRVHFVNGNIVDSVTRGGLLEGVNNKKFIRPDEKVQLENAVKRMLKDTDTHNENTVFGLDMTRDKNNKLRIIEANPNSGFIASISHPVEATLRPWEYWSTHKVLKSITGRETSFKAALKAAVVGTAASSSAALTKKASKESNNISKPLAVGAATAAGAFLLKKELGPKIYHVMASNLKPVSKGIGIEKLKFFMSGIKPVTTDAINNLYETAKIRKKDKIYIDLPTKLYTNVKDTILEDIRTINGSESISKIFDDKGNYKKLKHLHKFLAKDINLSSTQIKKIKESNINELPNILKNEIKDEYIIKPKSGSKGEGIIKSEDILKNKVFTEKMKISKSNKFPKALNLREFKDNPENYVIQKYSKPKKEARVTFNQNSYTYNIRHANNISIPNKKDYEVYDKIHKALKNELGDKAFRIGMDIGTFIDQKTKNVSHKIFDINMQEGFAWAYPGKFYKSVTKKQDPKAVSVLIGGATTGAGYRYYNKQK